MDNMTAALVGGLFDESGISAYARPVLFGTAGDAVRDALPHEKKTMLAMTDEMLQNTEDFTATLGSLTITQKVTFENCTVISEGENRIYWPEEGKTGRYTMDLRIAEN